VGKWGPSFYRGIGIISNGQLKISYAWYDGSFTGWDVIRSIEDSTLMTVAVGQFDPNNIGHEDFAIKQAWGPVKMYLYSQGWWNTPSATYHYHYTGHPGEDLPGYLYGGDFDGDGLTDLAIYSVTDPPGELGFILLD